MIEFNRDKNRFLRGKSVFTDDIEAKDVIYGLVVRSRIPNGEIKSIAAQTLPEGYFLVNHGMIPGSNSIRLPDGDMPCLAEKEVRYAGEPVILLAGPDRKVLKDLESGIDIRYGLKQPVYWIEDISAEKKLEESFVRGNVAEAMSLPDTDILSKTYSTGSQEHGSGEPHSVLSTWDADSERIVVYASTENPFHVRSTVARVLGFQDKAVRVIVPDTSDSLHGKTFYPSVIAAHASVITLLTKKPCKIVHSRVDDMLYSFKRHPSRIVLTTCSDKKGRLLAMKAEITIDCGAYRVNPRLELSRIMISLLNTYECENAEIEAFSVITNKVPCGPFAGLGEPQAAFALELHANAVAAMAQVDPYRWRKDNAKRVFITRQKSIPEGDSIFPVLDEAILKSDFIRKHAAYEALAKRSNKALLPNMLLRGIGLGFAFHGNGRPGASEFEDENHFVKLTLDKKGTLRICTSFVDYVANSEACLSVVASKILGIPRDDVYFEQVDTQTSPNSGPQWCSRTLYILGRTIEHSCHVLAQKMEKGATSAEVTRRVTLPPRSQKASSPLEDEGYSSYAAEGTVVEVEINPTTLQVYCRGIWIVMDAGEIVSEELARLAVEQAAVQNLGFASSEIVSFEIGRIEQKTLSEYKIPGIKDYPRIDVAFVQGEKKKKSAVFHGLGDQAVTCVAPAYVSAIVQALGRDFTTIPLTPEIIGV